MNTRTLVSVALAAALGLGCGKLPGTPSTPTVPGSDKVPGGLGGVSGEVDPNTCGNYAASDAGAKLKIFLQATKDLQTATLETVKVIKQSCIMMGNELGMPPGDLEGDDTNGICAKVITTYQNNLKVSLKPKASLKIKYVPAKCTVDASLSANAGGACSGGASAGTGGSGGGGQCGAAAAVNASLKATCTDAELSIEFDAKAALDTKKLEMTVKAARDGLPKLFSATARAKPIATAVEAWAKSASALAEMVVVKIHNAKAAEVTVIRKNCTIRVLGRNSRTVGQS